MSSDTIIAKLLRSPNAGHVAILLTIVAGGSANYSRVDDVAIEMAALRQEQTEIRIDQRDHERRLAAIERTLLR